MVARILAAVILAGAASGMAAADVTILEESFDSYADQAAFEANWAPVGGAGANGALVPGSSIPNLTPPNDDPPGIQGKAVNVFQGINLYVGPATSQMATLVPTATQNVRFSVDIFEDGQGNKTVTAGLRSTTPSNIFELGLMNFGPPDTNEPATDFAIRAVLLSGGGPTPSWYYFALNPALDRSDDLDEFVSIGDVGANHWHRWTADIGLAETTFTLDLYRDGLANSEATPGVGTPGVDASITFPIVLFGAPDPLSDLRIGTPSNIPNNPHEAVIDNVFLGLIDITPSGDDADFDGDGDVDGQDFLTWQRNAGRTGGATAMDGDANQDQNVDGLDLDVWQEQFGTVAAAVTSEAIPEPATSVLAVAAWAGLAAARRRRKLSA